MITPVTLTDNSYLIHSPSVSHESASQVFDAGGTGNVDNRQLPMAGRGPVTTVRLGNQAGILRHYRRGGFIANFNKDKFLWTGINQTRAVAEFRLLEWMQDQQLPVPMPLAAQVVRRGLFYSCDLITREVPNTETLAAKLNQRPIDSTRWNHIGFAIRALHDSMVYHSDLNANNILLNSQGHVTVIDFDKCRRRNGSAWKEENILRLKRSLDKLTRDQSIKHFTASGWQALLQSYQNN